MKKKILAVLLSAAMVAAMAMGCSSGGGTSAKADGEKAGKAEDMTFVVVPKCVHAWFDEVNKGAKGFTQISELTVAILQLAITLPT